ncbi:predicted protein, partial [Nematostella vectensis]
AITSLCVRQACNDISVCSPGVQRHLCVFARRATTYLCVRQACNNMCVFARRVITYLC